MPKTLRWDDFVAFFGDLKSRLKSTIVSRVAQTISSTADGGRNVVTFYDGNNVNIGTAEFYNGSKGSPGAAGNGISSIEIVYAASTSNIQPPFTWNTIVQSAAEGEYLWTRVRLKYTNGNYSDPYYTVARQGKNGSSITGQRGSKWFSGTALSGTSDTTGTYTWNDSEQKYVGDMYINPDNGNIYRCTTAGAGTNAKWTYQGNKWISILQSLCDYKSVYNPNKADVGFYRIVDFQNNGPADYISDLFGALICITDVSGGDACTFLDMQYYDSNDMVTYLGFLIYDSVGNPSMMEDGKSYIFKLQRKKINGSYIATIIAQW